MGVNTEYLRRMAPASVFGIPDESERDKIRMAADEIDTLRLVVSRLNERCEAVAKVTDDPRTYNLLNDAAWKVEQEIVHERAQLEDEHERAQSELRRLLLQIAQDNSPHDAQAMAERWAEEEYGPGWWRRDG